MTSEYPRTVNDHRGTVWACCESVIGRPCAHELHQASAPPAGTHLQFCANGYTLQGGLYDADDADEVRAWTEDGTCLGAVTRRDDGTWFTSASDAADWVTYTDEAFADWRTALAVIMAAGGYTMPADL